MSESRQIFIVGHMGLQNDLLLKYVASQTGLNCRLIESLSHLSQIIQVPKQASLLALCDCQGLCRDDLHTLLTDVDDEVYSSYMVAFFNLATGIEIENIALEYGVRGFFYENDSAASLIKGVDVLFTGDYWVSRQKIIECLTLEKKKNPSIKKERAVQKILTTREIEILSLIAMGGGNDVIAEKLCISPHTVRTHVYNIFKKIKVPSRLQASLWAAKNF